MIVVTGTFEIKPDGVATAIAAMADMVADTVKEDGCIVYKFWQDPAASNQFRVYEEWETDAHLAAHAATAHMATFRGKLGDVLVSRAVKKMSVSEVVDL